MGLPKFALFAGTAAATVYYWERIAAFVAPIFSTGAVRAVGQVGGAALLAVGAGTAAQSYDIDVTREMAVGFVDQLRKTRWREGTSDPVIWKVADKAYWIVMDGTIDSETLANDKGNPVTQRCLKLYVAKAEAMPGGYRMSSPYLINGKILKWPHIATDCRTQNGQTQHTTVEFLVRGEWKKTPCKVTEEDLTPQYCWRASTPGFF